MRRLPSPLLSLSRSRRSLISSGFVRVWMEACLLRYVFTSIGWIPSPRGPR